MSALVGNHCRSHPTIARIAGQDDSDPYQIGDVQARS
jgi:hypothetical protein